MQVNVHEAKRQLSGLLEPGWLAGESMLCQNGRPYARLVAIEPTPPRQLGFLRGSFVVGPEFFEPLSDEDLALWEGA